MMKKEFKKNIVNFMAKSIYKEAVKNANSTCVFYHGQPKMPKLVETLKK